MNKTQLTCRDPSIDLLTFCNKMSVIHRSLFCRLEYWFFLTRECEALRCGGYANT